MTTETVQQEIERLRNPDILQLEQVKRFSTWLDDRRKLGQPGRAVGNTGLGKTSAAIFYTFRNRASNQPHQSPTVPVLYLLYSILRSEAVPVAPSFSLNSF